MDFVGVKATEVSDYILELETELEQERKLNDYFKARFVICNTCSDDMKIKCPMFQDQFCNGERCNQIVDLVDLLDKAAENNAID